MRANQVVEAGGIEAIVYCLDTFSDDAEVVAAALGALRNINHPANHSCSVSDVIDHILKALENHNGEEEVQEHGCLEPFRNGVKLTLHTRLVRPKSHPLASPALTLIPLALHALS